MSSEQALKSEDVEGAKWDRCFERGIIKLGYGALAGGVIAAVLFRRPIPRSMVFGIGVGAAGGISFADCKYDFDNPDKVQIVTRTIKE